MFTSVFCLWYDYIYNICVFWYFGDRWCLISTKIALLLFCFQQRVLATVCEIKHVDAFLLFSPPTIMERSHGHNYRKPLLTCHVSLNPDCWNRCLISLRKNLPILGHGKSTVNVSGFQGKWVNGFTSRDIALRFRRVEFQSFLGASRRWSWVILSLKLT